MSAADLVDFEEMAAEQHRCPETQRLLGGTSLKLAFRQTGAQRLAGDVSTSTFRPTDPFIFRKTIFDNFRNVAQPGRLPPVVLSHPGLCGADFPATSPPGPAGVWPASGARFTTTHAWPPSLSPCRNGVFSHLHVDLVGPLQYSSSDYTSKWMEAIPLSETSAAACAKALTFTWISLFVVPETITSDCGPQFASSLWFQLFEMLNISHKRTTAYHPESNSAIERLQRLLKDALCACATTATWSKELPLYSSDSECSPGKTLVYSRLRQFLVPQLCCQMNFYNMMSFQLIL
jgi:hypothetical protein